MKIKKLLKDIPVEQVKGSKEIEISGVCANSKRVVPGNLFIAKKGFLDDGSRYIEEAVSSGASAVLTDIYDPSLKNVTQIICKNVAAVEPFIVSNFYEHPSKDLFMVGITGTNGKTTTSFLLKHLLDTLGEPAGLIGTIEYDTGKHRYQANRTTPDVCSNHKMLREMIKYDVKSCVMEVTSHALDQGRVSLIDFDVAIFTNLTQDHLDYHHTMENYFAAKKKLFLALEPSSQLKRGKFQKAAIVNADDLWHREMLKDVRVKTWTYGLHDHADIQAKDVQLIADGTDFTVTFNGKKERFHFPLIGRFNLYNCLAVITTALSQGYSLEKIAHGVSSFPKVPGRLEPVPNSLGINIYVDYAHTDDALKNVLECLQEVKRGRIFTVFGCGGDRDRVKRPKMAKVCEEFSDYCFVTSDNPRSENPMAIIQEILTGFKDKSRFEIEVDRQKAIEKAIEVARPSDVILIAGKGHETYQIFARQTLEFDDRKVAKDCCEQLMQQ